MKLPDELWQVVKDYLAEYFGRSVGDAERVMLESSTDITLFDGGAFISQGGEFDLFVLPSKRGRWRIRSEVSQYLTRMGKTYGKLTVWVHKRNATSLRLTKHFGFREVAREGDLIRLETSAWAN